MTIDDLRQILELQQKAIHTALIDRGYHYTSEFDFLLREGVAFPPAQRPRWCKRGLPRYCFANARKVLERHPDRVWYAEGYASNGVLPVPHAWLLDRKTGKVIDPTWDNARCYLGVVFCLSYVLDHDASGGGASIIGDWRRDWPLLKHKWNEQVALTCALA